VKEGIKLKVAIYIRVSTEEQVEEGYSIQAQKNRLEAYCVSQGWDIFNFYVDEGISAKNLERPELQRMIKHIEEGVVDCVLVYRLDRLTRSVLDLYQLLNVFEKYNCKFKSATEVYDTTTAMGRLFITLVAALAQWERENLGERIRMGLQQKASEGKWAVNISPLGYQRTGEHHDKLKVVPHEALLVKEIFNLYNSGNGMHKIARILNSRNILTKKGKKWSSAPLQYILTNPLYTGTTRYNFRVNKDHYFEVDDVVPPIISKEVFEFTQKILRSRKGAHPREATSTLIFSRVLVCARCGRKLSGRSSTTSRGDKKYFSYNYVCNGKSNGVCDMPAINENYLEERLLEIISEWDISEEVASLELENINEQNNNIEERIADLHNALEKIEKRRSKWQYAWVENVISDTIFKARMNEESEKEKMILQELEKLKPKEPATSNVIISEFLSKINSNWKEMSKIEKKQAIMITFESIVVNKNNKGRTSESVEIIDVTFK